MNGILTHSAVTQELAEKLKHTQEYFEKNGFMPAQNNGNLLTQEAFCASVFERMEDIKQELDNYRSGNTADKFPLDVSLDAYLSEFYQFTAKEEGDNSPFPNTLLNMAGIDPNRTTLTNLSSYTQYKGVRFLVPEVYREAIRQGLRANAFWRNLIASEQTVQALNVRMPRITEPNVSLQRVGEGETIPSGGVWTTGVKSVDIDKYGIFLRMTRESMEYVTLNFQVENVTAVGRQMAFGLDNLLVDTLLNGEQADGSESAHSVGVSDTNEGIQYADVLRTLIHLSRLGYNASDIIAGEAAANALLNLEEFKAMAGTNVLMDLNIQSPIPSRLNVYIHPAIPANQIVLLDRSQTAVKVNAQALVIESDMDIKQQLMEMAASMRTAFAIQLRDARVILDGGTSFNGFPAAMDIDSAYTGHSFGS